MFETVAGKVLLTFLLSMVPVFELRAALPFGVGLGLDPWLSLVVSIIGNMVPVPFIILFIRKILDWMKRFDRFRRIAEKLENKAAQHEDKIRKYQALGLFFLVAVPLPGTGAWTGTLGASLLDMKFKETVIAVMLGVLIAGLIMMAVSLGLFTALFAAIGK